MDPNQDFLKKKEALYKELLDLMIKALQNNQITAEDSEKVSRIIVEGFDKANDIYYLKAVVEEVSEKWEVFKPALLSFEVSENEAKDQAQVEDVQKAIEELKTLN